MSQGPQAGCAARVARHPGRGRRRGHVHRPPGHAPARLRRRRTPVTRRPSRPRPPSTNVGGHGRALDLRDPVAGVQREDPVHRRTTSGTTCSRSRRTCCTCRARPSPTPPSARGSASLLEEELRRRAARGLRARHASRRRRPAARRHDALGGSRRRARTAHRSRVAAERAVRAARPDPRAARRGRGRPRDGRHRRRPAHARDALRARRPGGRRRRRVPLPAAAVGLRHPSSGARPLPHRASRRDLHRRAGRRTRSAASPPRTTSRPRSHVARSTPPIRWRRSTASRSPSPTTRSRCR